MSASAKGFLAVAGRELQEKWFVFPAAAVTSLVPFVIPLLRGLHGGRAAEVRDWTALIGALSFAAGLAIALGSTAIANDLADRRLGFYFSRPISGLVLWSGKVVAAWLLAVSAAAIVYLPTRVVDGSSRAMLDLWVQASFSPAPFWRQAPLAFLLGMAALVLVLHAIGILVRTRSPLVALDMAALLLLSFIVVAVLQKLSLLSAVGPPAIAVSTLAAATVVACGVAGLRAVTRGRSDGSAAHRALSTTLWSILGAGVAATGLYAAWVRSVGPKDLTSIDWVFPGGSGSWISVQGTAKGWEPTFLYDTASGRFLRAGSTWLGPAVSKDGKKAAWLEASKRGGPYDVVTSRLDDPAAKPGGPISLSSIPSAAFLSDDGGRLATISQGVLTVWIPEDGTSLASVRLWGPEAQLHGYFLDPNRILALRFLDRWARWAASRVDVLEFDVRTRVLKTVFSLEDAVGCVFDAREDRLLVTGQKDLRLHDGHTGALLAVLSERSSLRSARGRFTSDGRIVVAVTEGPGPGASPLEARARKAHVDVFTRDGRPERTLDLPAFDRLSLGGEIASGQLVLLGARGLSPGKESRTLWLADLSTGAAKEVAEGLSPIWPLTEPGSEATKLFFGLNRSLVRFDPLTGERRVVLGGSQ